MRTSCANRSRAVEVATMPPRCCTGPAAPAAPPKSLVASSRLLARPSDSLCDLLLVGTHDSCAYKIDPSVTSRSALPALRVGLVRKGTAGAIRDVSQTQELDVLGQLQAGVRFLDLRVSKLPPASNDKRFWTVHGMAVCVPLEDILLQINSFHDLVAAGDHEATADQFPVPVVSVIRPLDLDAAEQEELALLVQSTLRGGIFSGSARDLRLATLADLPRNVVAGLPPLSALPAEWGYDAFTDTYMSDVKIKFLLDYMTPLKPRQTRDDISVIGWTVTPQLKDVVRRILTAGVRPRTLKSEALLMNARFPEFLKENGQIVASVANVVFCDFLDNTFANFVIDASNSNLLRDKK
jgi:hypothetical protein